VILRATLGLLKSFLWGWQNFDSGCSLPFAPHATAGLPSSANHQEGLPLD